MKKKSTYIDGLFILEREKFEDPRGSFERLFCIDTLSSAANFDQLAQANISRTSNIGTVRGLHLQRAPKCEKKVVSCIRGSILDVAVDMRSDSPTFLKHFSMELNEQNKHSLLIPEGVAHGFQSLSNDIELIYFHSCNYSFEHEMGFNPLDPMLNISWPLKVSCISDKDANHKFLSDDFTGLIV